MFGMMPSWWSAVAVCVAWGVLAGLTLGALAVVVSRVIL